MQLQPLGVAFVEGQRGRDVCHQAELAEDGVEVAPPLAVVGLFDVKQHGDMGADVDLLNHGWRSGRKDDLASGGVRGGSEWEGEAMAAEEEDANGLIKADCSVTDTMKEEKTRERERSTALLIDR
jgi:hypothetical protein